MVEGAELWNKKIAEVKLQKKKIAACLKEGQDALFK